LTHIHLHYSLKYSNDISAQKKNQLAWYLRHLGIFIRLIGYSSLKDLPDIHLYIFFKKLSDSIMFQVKILKLANKNILTFHFLKHCKKTTLSLKIRIKIKACMQGFFSLFITIFFFQFYEG